MPLKFPAKWRFEPPPDGEYHNSSIPQELANEFVRLALQTSKQGDPKAIVEHFKEHFCLAAGKPYSSSSSLGWAESDLYRDAFRAAENAPLFLEAFHTACVTLTTWDTTEYVPDAELINGLCVKLDIGYQIVGRELQLREELDQDIAVDNPPETLTETAWRNLRESMDESDRLLAQGKGRQAIQELLWVLETLSTAFRRDNDDGPTVRGKYFNQIVRDLKNAEPGSTFNQALHWLKALHGYLSSPTGGRVRHGADLRQLVELSGNEARLFCNLIRSYIVYLIGEHRRLFRDKTV